LTSPGMQTKRPSEEDLDEFAALGIDASSQIKDLFCPNFYFGCEADDPMTSVAFQTGLWPHGAQLKPFYGSDISHFDVPVMANVLAEAHESVEHGHMSAEHFRDFVFTNPVSFYADSNPDFFAGTVVEGHAAALISHR
jgi:hypothetical protein